MKAIILTIALALTATFAIAQFPQSQVADSNCYISENIRATILDKSGAIIEVKIAKLPGEVVKIRIHDENEIIHQTRVKKHELVDLDFDLSNLPEGKYIVEILDRNNVVFSKEITYANTEQYLARK